MASPLTVFASSYAADGVLAGWSNPTYAYADDTNFATSGGTRNTWYGTLYGFDLSGIPDGATVTSVTLLARFKGNTTDTNIQFFLGAKSGGSEVGSGTVDTTQTASEEDVVYQPVGLSAAALKATGDNGFWAITRYRRTSSLPRVGYLDYVTCTVEYTEGATPDALTSKDISSGVPTVDKATIGQKHALVSKDVASGIPAVDKPTLSQKHALVSKDIATPAPTVDKPTLGISHVLVSKDIASGIPSVEKPTIAQKHALVSKDIATPAPLVDKPTLTQIHALTSKDVLSGVPTVDKPTIGQVHALTSKDISSGAPNVEKPTLANVAGTDNLTAQDIVSGVPVVDKPTLGVIEVSQDYAAAALFQWAKYRNDDDEVLAIYAILENEW